MEFTTYRFKYCVTEIIDNRGRNPDKYYDAEKYPVIDNYLIKNELHPVVANANRFLSQSQFDNFLRGYVTEDDLLMTLVGNGIGNVSLSPNDKIAIVQNTVGFRLNQELLDSHFAFYYFKTINSAVRSLDRGASQPSVNRTDVLRLKIQVPSINTQKQIADILSTYDELIENNNKRITILEQMAENLYKEWFVRFRFPGYETAKFENGIPVGWEIKKNGDILNCFDTKRVPLSSMDRDTRAKIYPYYGAASLMDYVDDYLFDGTFLLLGEDGTVITPDGHPVLQYVWGKFWVNNHAHVFQGKGAISTETLYLMFKNMPILDIVTGVAQPKISQGRLFKKKVLCPTEDLLIKFSELVKPIFDEIKLVSEGNKNLIKQRDLLLPRLMSGKLEV